MTTSHVSELAIDRLLANELATADATAVRDHAATCGACGALLDDALAVRQAFAADRPRLVLPRRRPTAALGAAVTALAAAVALVLVWPHRGEEPEPGGTRAKGTAIVGFFVAHGDAVRAGGRRETVVPGDRLELFTTTSAPGYFAAVATDARGARSVFVAPRPVTAGREQVIPAAVELDDALGPATVTGVFCAAPFEPLAIDLAAPPAGCTVDHFALDVVPR